MGAGSPPLTLPFMPERSGRQRPVSDTLAIQCYAAHYRLVHADAGMRLTSVEAISPFHQEGSVEGSIRWGGKAQGRAFGK